MPSNTIGDLQTATDTLTYNNWTYLQGTTSSDGKTGNWTVYYSNTQKTEIQYNWSTSTSGTVTGIVQEFDTNGNLTEKISLVNNPDKSGEVDVYEGTIPIFKATWVSNGSGEWWEYDPSTGAQIYHGTWT